MRPYSVFAGAGAFLSRTSVRSSSRSLIARRNACRSWRRRHAAISRGGDIRCFGRYLRGRCRQRKVMVYDGNGGYRTSYAVDNGKPVALAMNERLGILYVADASNTGSLPWTSRDSSCSPSALLAATTASSMCPSPLPSAQMTNCMSSTAATSGAGLRCQGGYLFKFGAVGDRAGLFANPKGSPWIPQAKSM